ncbi:hypothetical protein DPMN_034926 [Dreissena polymorpha]|uniref:Uncharacterized protein n=1 Tax=Dreissena polymorpha TaxID=45954 RepID=A0A9D4M6K4_DREPO|nr:hypothetical protein DPMN_034926 [Dreissena polymorpha]
MTSTTIQPIPDRTSPGSPRAAPSAAHQGGGGKCAEQSSPCQKQHHYWYLEC